MNKTHKRLTASKSHLSANSVIRASSPKTTKRPVVHRSDEHGVGVLYTPSIDRQQAIADCQREFSGDEIIGVPECPDCNKCTDIRYYWTRNLWSCQNCGRSVPAESPETLPQEKAE